MSGVIKFKLSNYYKLALASIFLSAIAQTSAADSIFYREVDGCRFYFQNQEVAGGYTKFMEISSALTGNDMGRFRLESICQIAPRSVVTIMKHPDIPNTEWYRGIYALGTTENGVDSKTEYYIVRGCPITLEIWSENNFTKSTTSYRQACLNGSTSTPEIVYNDNGSFTGRCSNGQRFSGEYTNGAYVVSGPSRTAIKSTISEAVNSSCGN